MLISLALLLGVAVMVIVVVNPDNLPLCGDSVVGDCFDQTRIQYDVQRVAAAAAALVGALAALVGFYVGATGRRGALMVKVTVVALALGD